MATSVTTINLDKVASIAPFLLDKSGVQIPWDLAVSGLEATVVWEDLQFARTIGTAEVLSNGHLRFKPHTPGSFTLRCKVTYKEAKTNKFLVMNGSLFFTVPVGDINSINVSYTPGTVEISPLNGNRLSKDPTGALYVPEVQVDLMAWFLLGKS